MSLGLSLECDAILTRWEVGRLSSALEEEKFLNVRACSKYERGKKTGQKSMSVEEKGVQRGGEQGDEREPGQALRSVEQGGKW